jgi:hypothetical protein
MGEMWETDQLSILPAAYTDRDTFIAEIVKDKMAYLGGRIEGQLIDIEAKNCARVELFLPQGLVDFTRPVTVKCNGKRRHEGVIEPSIGTLLETAYEEWEFQHPYVARLSFSVKLKTSR